MPTRSWAAALTLAVALVTAGCSGDSSSEPAVDTGSSDAAAAGDAASAAPSPSAPTPVAPTPTPTSYLPVPAGVTLTEQGSALAVGQQATVAWQPRQDITGVLDITVDRIERTTLKRSFAGWQIPEASQTATPYFVRATITNRGDTDLSGRAVPLYIVDATNTLIEATSFASAFRPCRDGVFPAAFGPTATAQVCLVYFAPEGRALTAASFRPTQEFNPITWTGEIVPARRTGPAVE